jgi:hypothetical protein
VRQVPIQEDDVLPDADEERGRAHDDVCDVYELSEPLEVLTWDLADIEGKETEYNEEESEPLHRIC